MKLRSSPSPAGPSSRAEATALTSAAETGRPRMLTSDEFRRLSPAERERYFQSLVALVPEPPAIPPLMRSMAKELDRLAARLHADPSLKLEDLLNEYLGGEAKRGEATKLQAAVFRANIAAILAVAAQIALQVTSLTDVATLALVFNAVWKGYALGPVQILHEVNDQYETGDRGVEFKMHHLRCAELTKWDDAYTSYSLGKYALPILAATALVNPAAPVGMAILTFCVAAISTMPAHMRSHFANPAKLGPIARWLQRAGVTSDFAHHDKHHSGRKEGLMHEEEPMKHVGGYDVLTGDMLFSAQDIVDSHDLARKAEVFVHHLTKRITGEGLEPECWAVYPELKEAWLGPPEQREATLRKGRIERYETKIRAEEASLEALRAAPSGKESLIQAREAGLAKMKAQLALFRDPAAQQELLSRYQASMKALEAFHFRGWERPSTREELARAPGEDARLRSEAKALQDQLAELAPWLTLVAKPSARLSRPDPARIFGARGAAPTRSP